MIGRTPASILLLGVAVSLIAGCGGPPPIKPVDTELARSTLKKTLEHWKSGGKPEELQKGTPPVIVNDFDWPLGYRLTGYEVLGLGEPRESILFCEVKLQLADEEGNTEEKTVAYNIGTEETLSVIRAVP